jgi:hypothetical protein
MYVPAERRRSSSCTARTSRFERRSPKPRVGATVPAASRTCALAFAPSPCGRVANSASAPMAAAVTREMIGRARVIRQSC